jgi:hypothetical protein
VVSVLVINAETEVDVEEVLRGEGDLLWTVSNSIPISLMAI